MMLNLLHEILKNPPQELIKIYYLFYDIDNPCIVKNLNYEMIY